MNKSIDIDKKESIQTYYKIIHHDQYQLLKILTHSNLFQFLLKYLYYNPKTKNQHKIDSTYRPKKNIS